MNRGASLESGVLLLKAAGFDVVGGEGGVEEEEWRGGRGWADRVFSQEVFQAVLKKQRRDKGLGADGWQGVLAKWAPEWMQERYRLGAIGVAVDLDFPGEWLTHHVRMIPRAGRDPALFSKNRDIWLSPHGWSIMTGCFRVEYEKAQERMSVPASLFLVVMTML